MTATDFNLENWQSTTFGKAARISIAVLGVITATLTLTLASMIGNGSWVMVLGGVALAATSIRAAQRPDVLRLTVVAANLMVIPLLAQLG